MDRDRKVKIRKEEKKKMAIDYNLVGDVQKSIPHEITVEEMERELGFENTRPIIALTPSEEKVLTDDADTFEKLYIEELKKYYVNRQYLY